MKLGKASKILIISLLFGIINVYTSFITKNDGRIFFQNVILIVNIIVVALLFAFLGNKLERYCGLVCLNKCSENYHSYKKTFWKTFFLQVVIWLVFFCAYYPGITGYDFGGQIPQTIGGIASEKTNWISRNYTTHHPLLHTLYLQFFYYIIGGKIFSDYNIGIAIGTIIQIIIFSLMIAFSHAYLNACGVIKCIRYAYVLFTCFFPYYSMIVIANIKDVFFAGFVAVLFTCLSYFTNSGVVFFERRKINCIFILSVIGCILFRNNGLYPCLAIAIVQLIISFKKNNWKVFSMIFGGCTFALLLLAILFRVLQADKGSPNEMLSIPYQQISAVYNEHYDELSDYVRDEIELIVPNVSKYTKNISDPVKDEANGFANLGVFLRLYFELGLEFPQSYINAFLNTNAGYLSIADVGFDVVKGSMGMIETDTNNSLETVKQRPILPVLHDFLEFLYTDNNYQSIFVFRIICRPAIYMWMETLLLIFAFTKRRSAILPLVFFVTLVLTMLAGPCVLVRYMLPVVVCIPGIIGLFYSKSLRD